MGNNAASERRVIPRNDEVCFRRPSRSPWNGRGEIGWFTSTARKLHHQQLASFITEKSGNSGVGFMSDHLAQRFFDTNVRIEKMFWISGICVAAPRDFEEFVEDDLYDNCAPAVLEALPFLKGLEGSDGETVLSEMAMHRKNGFIVQVATPRPYECRPDGSHSFSWGSYYTKWLYADTLDELASIALAWGEGVLSDAKSKAVAA